MGLEPAIKEEIVQSQEVRGAGAWGAAEAKGSASPGKAGSSQAEGRGGQG